jgi:hypothetical protein
MSASHPKATACCVALSDALGQKPDSCTAARSDYSITSSAVASRVCGMVRPNAFAVLRLAIV